MRVSRGPQTRQGQAWGREPHRGGPKSPGCPRPRLMARSLRLVPPVPGEPDRPLEKGKGCAWAVRAQCLHLLSAENTPSWYDMDNM